MTSGKLLISSVALISVVAMVVFPQGDAKHFTKDGLVFDYAKGWEITDGSNSDAQQLTLTNTANDAQISLFAHRGKIDTPEKFAQAKKAFIDPYVKSNNDRFLQVGAKPQSSPATSEIGGVPAEGVRIKVTLGGEPGEADIYWATLNNRVVVLTFFGSDKELKKATPAWDIIRTSLKVEAAPPKASPSKKP